MAVTGAIFKTLTFNGESSKDYGVYITGAGVYDAPKRDVEMITILGRSGSFPLDHGRYENIEVTYPAGIYGDNEEDFAELISDFRNMLCSANGYCRLEDEYNPDEYRMAVYKSGLEVDPTLLKAGEFDITFECKPQRYLKSGEVPVTMGDWADVETHTGNPIILNTDKEVKNLDVELLPIQDLHGYSKPWSAGAGKNKFNKDGTDTSNGYIAGKYLKNDGTSYTPSSSVVWNVSEYIKVQPSTKYTLSGLPTSSSNAPSICWYDSNKTFVDGVAYSNNATRTITTGDNIEYVRLSIPQVQIDGLQLEIGETATSYEPYTNICPITGHDSVTVTDTDGDNTNTTTVTLPHTVYGAGVGVTSGESKETWANIPSYNGETITEPWLSSMDEYAQGTTPTTGAQVTYKLATPTDLSTTPTDITLYNGDNVISSDGVMTLEIGNLISGVDNPTRFEASPELQIKGYGTVAFNGYQIAIDDQPYGDVELMDNVYKPYGSTLTLGTDDYAINGDAITVSANMPIAFGTRSDSYEIRSASLYTGTTNGTPYCTILNSHSAQMGVDGSTFNFLKGTTNTATLSIAYNVTVRHNGSDSVYRITLTYTVSYNATNDTIEITVTNSTSPSTPAVFTRKTTRPTISASVYGSKSVLGDPTIIDCENGEVYKEVSDGIVSLNSYIDLGAELPKLATGENPVTTTGSITECVIIPRWWKL